MTTIELQFRDELVVGHDKRTLLAQCEEGLIIRRYLGNEISIGKVAELMKMRVEQAIDWLHGFGIPTARIYPPEVEAEDDARMEKATSRLRKA